MNHPPPVRGYTLRVSLTRRCSLRCPYCHEPEACDKASSELGDETLIALIGAIAETVPLRRVRLTGGEPLLRSGLLGIVERLRAALSDTELCLTTNGLKLASMAAPLRKAGLDRVSVSLDAATRDNYRRVVGFDGFDAVLAGIEALHEAGFSRVKLNTVLLATLNGDSLPSQVELARRLKAEARFIELMPIGPGRDIFDREHLSADAVLDRLRARYPVITPLGLEGTASRYRLENADHAVEIGLISPMTHPFCETCDRLRLDAQGRLYTCLRQEEGVMLGELAMANEWTALQERLRETITSKHPFAVWPNRTMQSLGG